ncbi:hypothetical protein AQUCO_03700282v1 [Aquilegia coerulea]|uniref:Uncharacterized protein n=1 Tax=Aquilegia coerulea TaxID=218851 RepID=A0A2G5CUF7_AQUCA|nr:hypothetical protein AQUCO_03700282v1 [Aquilegia coerulea]
MQQKEIMDENGDLAYSRIKMISFFLSASNQIESMDGCLKQLDDGELVINVKAHAHTMPNDLLVTLDVI